MGLGRADSGSQKLTPDDLNSCGLAGTRLCFSPRRGRAGATLGGEPPLPSERGPRYFLPTEHPTVWGCGGDPTVSAWTDAEASDVEATGHD